MAGTFFERFTGMIAVSLFSSCYYYSVLYPLSILIVALVWRDWVFLAVYAAPCIISILLPSRPMPNILALKFFKNALKYHDYEEVLEIGDEELVAAMDKQRFIHACQPHGVMSVVGICHAISRAPAKIPATAVASVLLKIPLMKQLFGLFNLVDASKRSLMRVLKKDSVVIYVGGMAELFLSTPEEERLYIAKRTGFIKLALETGSDICPAYFFGNTTTLEIYKGKTLAAISRSLGVSITLFWGRWGLPIPKPKKVLYVRGTPLGMPSEPNPNPGDELVKEWQTKYISEVQRIFEKYKDKVPDYAHKRLILDT